MGHRCGLGQHGIASRNGQGCQLASPRSFPGLARAYGLSSDDEARQFLGEEFPKPAFHQIVAIAAIWASYEDDRMWRIRKVKALHARADMGEREIVAEFMRTIDHLLPILVSYNGAAFDVPVLQWRALLHNVAGLSLSRYSTKYSGRAADLHIDLCEELAGRDGRGRIKLDQACKFLGVEGKTVGVDGSHVSVLASEGKFRTIADYCADDVAATMRLFYRRELYKNGWTRRVSKPAWTTSAPPWAAPRRLHGPSIQGMTAETFSPWRRAAAPLRPSLQN